MPDADVADTIAQAIKTKIETSGHANTITKRVRFQLERDVALEVPLQLPYWGVVIGNSDVGPDGDLDVDVEGAAWEKVKIEILCYVRLFTDKPDQHTLFGKTDRTGLMPMRWAAQKDFHGNLFTAEMDNQIVTAYVTGKLAPELTGRSAGSDNEIATFAARSGIVLTYTVASG